MTQQNFTVDYGLTVAGSGGNITGATNIEASGNITAHDATFGGNINGVGNFDVDGNATVGGNLFVTGNINFSGNVTQISGNSGVFYGNASTGVGALYAGKTGYTPLPSTIVQMTGDENAYIQTNLQNTNHGNTSSMELAITADDGTDTTNYIDMGIASSTWDGTQDNSLGTAVNARDGYLYVQGGSTGGNLVLGTTTAGYAVKFNAGGPGSANTVAQISNTGITTTGIVSATGNVRGANINTAGIVSATGNITGGNLIATANVLGSGYARFVGTFDEAQASTAGLYLGYAGGTPRMMFGTGNTSQTFEIDNDGGNLRFYQPGSTKATLTPAGDFSALGNVTSGNINTSGLISATGNVQAGNVRTVGQVSATGNVYAGSSGATGFILGNVNSKIGILGSNATITLSQNIALTPDTSGSALAGIQIGGNGYLLAANGARVLTLGTNGSATVNGNINQTLPGYQISTAGNIVAAGYVSAVGNVTGGNIITGGIISATGNITTAGNFVGNGAALTNVTVSVAGNVIGTQSNVTLVAGSYSTVIDNTGVATFPGNVSVVGNVITPNRPAFRVYGNTSTVFTSNTTITNQVVDYNQGSNYNNTTGIFTAPVAGIYQTQATLRVANNNGLNQASIQKNSSNTGSNVVAFWETDTNVGVSTHFPLTGAAKLAVGDTLRLQVISGNVQFDVNDSWSVTFIG